MKASTMPMRTGSTKALPYFVTRFAWILVGVKGSLSVDAWISHSAEAVPIRSPCGSDDAHRITLRSSELRMREMACASVTTPN